MLMASATSAFDRVARSYDDDFTDTTLGRALRKQVWERLSRSFAPGAHVLELNCGTGEDACFLASRGVAVTATDGSAGMLERAERKVKLVRPEAPVRFRKLDLQEPLADFAPESFDGAFSNFGGLNCVHDLGPLAVRLGQWLRPGAPVLLVVMGPLCMWEVVTELLRGRPRRAFRRLQGEGAVARIGGKEVRVRYPPPSELRRAFAPWFSWERIDGLGVVLPPSLWSHAMEAHPRLLRLLTAADETVRSSWPFRFLGDHYVSEMRRRR